MAAAHSRTLIIGCGDIGMATARRIGRRQPLVVTDVDPERLKKARAALEGEGITVDCFPCDITNAASVESLADHVRSGAGLGAVVHVAALAPSCGDWRKLMTVNLIGPHFVARALGPLIESGGIAVFIGSVAAYVSGISPQLRAVLAEPLDAQFWARLEATAPGPIDANLAYCYSKAALLAYCERLAIQWGPRSVRAASVSPGLIQSEMGIRERAHNPESLKLVDATPLKREGTVAEAAAVIDFAASEAASFLNGVDLLVDGGLRAALNAPK